MNIPPNDSPAVRATSVPKIWPLPNLLERKPVMAVLLVGALLAIAVLLVKMWSLAHGGMVIMAAAITVSYVFILVGALYPRRAKR